MGKVWFRSILCSAIVTLLLFLGFLHNSRQKADITYDNIVDQQESVNQVEVNEHNNDNDADLVQIDENSGLEKGDEREEIEYSDQITNNENEEEFQQASETEYQDYVNHLCAFDFVGASRIAGDSKNQAIRALYEDSAMLIYMEQLKAAGDDASIGKKLTKNTFFNPINFFVVALYTNSYYRTPIIYCRDSLNPEFTTLGNLVVEEVPNTFDLGEATATYKATFELDGYQMESIFFDSENGFRIYRIDSLETEEIPFISVEKYEEIRRKMS